MKSTIRIAAVCTICIGILACNEDKKSTAPDQKPQPPVIVDTLAYIQRLEGTWISADSNYKETWDETLTGGGYSLTDSGETLNENLRIFRQDGRWYYGASVIDQNEGSEIQFELTLADSARLVFENPRHDFPTHIEYTFSDSGRVVISVRDNHNGFKIHAKKAN